MEKAKISSLNSDLLDFVNKRTTASFRAMLYKNQRTSKKYRKFQDRAKKLYEEILRRLGSSTEAWELIDEYESLEGLLAGIEADYAYLQGLSDGLRLRKLL
ncbi:MAG: hypothetical protein HPY50_07030 [Firmicutes bacterium]|nr:hypothetical protein [Bacillota bacterium]